MAIHLLNPLWDATGGSEWRTISLFELLAEHADVSVWTEYPPDASLRGRVPMREMLVSRAFPTSGTFVFVGAYWEIGPWVKMAKPERVILVYNVVDPEMLDHRLAQLASYGVQDVELVFSSELAAQHAGGRPGRVELSPIDLGRFTPRVPADRPLTVGRHSRDYEFKHHPSDPELYTKLADEGFRIRILGGTCLGDKLGVPGVEMLPANAEPAPDFLRSLDIFFYRTSPGWVESYGRVVAEAMATGLPCVLGKGGGYEALVQHGVNGFLVDDDEEALDVLHRLREPELRRRVGAAARETILARYEQERQETLEFYLR